MKFVILSIIAVALIGCDFTGTIALNQSAQDIAAAESRGEMVQIKSKEVLLGILDEWIEDFFSVGGFDHRLKEAQENWKVFDLNTHLVICGSVARSDNDIHLFTWVIEKNEGNLDTEFLQIGGSIEKGTEYPPDLAPYAKG